MALGKKNVVGILCGLSFLGFACALFCSFAGSKGVSASFNNAWEVQGEKQGQINITKDQVDKNEASFEVYCIDPACPKAAEIAPPCKASGNSTMPYGDKTYEHICTIEIKNPVVGLKKVTAPQDIYVMPSGMAGVNKQLKAVVGGLGAALLGTAGMVCCGFCGVIFLITGLCFMVCGKDDSAGARGVSVERLAPEAVQYKLLH
eukprot:TRINITY_DN8206_c1_g1_i1.p1 TRINITY_DN8206_c1_g1~~TRINITY_DN8206_c1_g1_i1.p1  ORF type:complete len:222 (-),score=29.10 TRINITY_DN8206_c1_g1_i1:408-1016(-)